MREALLLCLMTTTSESSRLSWRIQQDTGISRVQFHGEIDETADFSELTAWLSGQVEFHLQGVTHINSVGAREWIQLARSLPAVTSLSLAYCSAAVVAQLNMISNFKGQGVVSSFFAPYVCGACGTEVNKLLDVKICFPDPKTRHPPTFTCDSCSHPLDFDEVPEHYMAFLKDT